MSDLHMPTLSAEAAAKLRNILDIACGGENPAVASTVMQVVTASGETLFVHSAGKFTAMPSKDSAETYPSRAMKPNDIVPLLSCTKLIVTIAAMQLVEKGLLDLDSPDLIEKHLPELMSKKVLLGYEDNEPGDTGPRKPILEERRSPITARMLLTNTAGLSYTFFNSLLFEYIGFSLDKNEGSDPWGCMKTTPLTSQPGTVWSYGQSIDWIGILIERLIPTTMKTYLSQNIYHPLEMPDTSLDIDLQSRDPSRIVPLRFKSPNGKFTSIAHSIRHVEPIDSSPPAPDPKPPYWGGGSIFSTPTDFSHLLCTLLNNGISPKTHTAILTPHSTKTILSPSMPPHIPIPPLIQPTTSFALPLNLKALNPNIEIGFGCAVQGSDRVLPGLGGKGGRGEGGRGKGGRRKGSAYWFGGFNAEWWVDGECGVTVALFSCSAPWNEEMWVGLVAELEGELYEGLRL